MAEQRPHMAKAKEDDFHSLLDPVYFNVTRQRERIQEHIRLDLPEPPTPVKHLDALCSTHDCDWDKFTTIEILCQFRDERIRELIGQFQVIVHYEKPRADAFADPSDYDRRFKAWRTSVRLLANLYTAAVWSQQMRFLRDAGKTEIFNRQVEVLNAAKQDPGRKTQLQELQDAISRGRGALTEGAGNEGRRSSIDEDNRAEAGEVEKIQQEEREALEAGFSDWELDVIDRFAAKVRSLRKPATAPRRRPLIGRKVELARHIVDLVRRGKEPPPSLVRQMRQTTQLEKEFDASTRASSSALQDPQVGPSGPASRTTAATEHDSAVATGQEGARAVDVAVADTSNNVQSGASNKQFVDHDGRAHVRGSKGQFQRKNGSTGKTPRNSKGRLAKWKANPGAAATSRPYDAAPASQEAAAGGAGRKRGYSNILDEAPASKNEAVSRTIHPKRVKMTHSGGIKGNEGQATSDDSSRVASGDVAAEDVAAAKVNAGDVSAGDLAAGDLAAGDLAAGDLAAGDLAAGDVNTGGVDVGVSLRTDIGAEHQSIDNEPQGIDDERSKIAPSATELLSEGQNMHTVHSQAEHRPGIVDVVAPIDKLAESLSPITGPGAEVSSSAPIPARRRLILRNSGPRPPAPSSS